MLMAKAALTAPADPSLFVGYRTDPNRSLPYYPNHRFRIAISADHEIGLIIGENHGLHRS
ncbi:MAG: hypothetical protein ABS69_13955 [Nitrosomonadales bacterium SCN 54-20]|nr:MAG: hypothetical protein ABS69_13955 [Nitrosomonadales bacterium SCN 54-20]